MFKRLKQNAADLENKYVKGEYYYIDYKRVPNEQRQEALHKGLMAGLIRIVAGAAVLAVAVIVLMNVVGNL